ncbi:hypothetical protein [Xanthomonas cissicola]|nr:hypothetical protein [Xanthomonas cissicola]
MPWQTGGDPTPDRGDIASFTVEANDAAASIVRLTLPLIRH